MIREPVKFGRWLLKHADTGIDENGMFVWLYATKEYNTHKLYEVYLRDELGVNNLM